MDLIGTVSVFVFVNDSVICEVTKLLMIYSLFTIITNRITQVYSTVLSESGVTVKTLSDARFSALID